MVPLERYQFTGNGINDGPVSFGIRPEHIVVGEQAASLPFHMEVAAEVVEPMGSDTLVWTRLAGQDFRFRVDGQLPLKEGQRELIGFDPSRASIFDAETELRL